MKNEIRALELYSGIGGMHYALKESGIENINVVAAVDISPLANSVYRHNFPETLHIEKGIEGFSVKELDTMMFNILVMSPPCQPFTRIGLKKDIDDPRTKSFLHLLKILPQLKQPPLYVLLENVKGFEASKAHQMFCDMLDQLDYQRQGFLISPKQLGIPNSRLRYYLLAKRKPMSFSKEWFKPDDVLDELPHLHKSCKFGSNDSKKSQTSSSGVDPVCEESCRTLQSFLEDTESTFREYEIPANILERYLPVMDIVTPQSIGSTCFTKSYGHYIEGTGSLLNMSTIDCKVLSTNRKKEDFQLRYFMPREIANILCFPKESFSFPESLTRKQSYRLLGNSLNVRVVAYLLTLLLQEDTQ